MFCQKCGKQIPDGTGKVLDGHLVCEECAAASVKCFCQRCGKEIPPDTEPQASGKLLCEDCAELPDDSENDEAFWSPDKPKPEAVRQKLPMLPVWIAALSLVIVAGAVAALFGTKTLCWHEWAPATCQQPEICEKCGRAHGDPLPHKWKEATCTEPRNCMLCGETEGEPLGHDWLDATCTEPRTCSRCHETMGEPAGHTWEPANCLHPMTCSICGEEKGRIGSHKWQPATCEEPRTCKFCGAAEGESLGHQWLDATCTEPKTCEVCGKTEGEPAGHQWKAATVLSPKICEICGETEGTALDIRSMTALDLMEVTKGDFTAATGDAHHEAIGCDECSGSSGTLVCSMFPGCILAYSGGADSLPDHLHIFEGNITANTAVGMSCADLIEVCGTPSWSLSESDHTVTANYIIGEHSVGFVFTDKKLLDDLIDFQMGKTKGISTSDPSIKVVAAKIS